MTLLKAPSSLQDSAAPSLSTPPRPDAIIAGLGLVERHGLCGLLALLETLGSIELARGAVDVVQEKLGRQVSGLSERLNRRAEALSAEGMSEDVLRHRLWLALVQALNVPSVLPLSTRKLNEASAAIAVRAADVLSPMIHAKRAAATVDGISAFEKAGRLFGGLVKDPRQFFEAKPVLSFPDVIAEEAFRLLEGLDAAEGSGRLDPEVAKAVAAGKAAAGNVAAVGGAWAAFAALVQGAGFAPYILAAQASAFIPFVSGPVAVSFLAVLVNPFTLIAGLAALGYWGVAKQGEGVRRIAAAQVAAILALAGMGREAEGTAALVSAFRRLADLGPDDLAHLPKKDALAVRRKVARLNSRLSRGLPSAVRPVSSRWTAPLAVARSGGDLEVPLVGAVTLADLIYHAAAIDPKVLAAADFSRSMDIEGPVDFAGRIGAFLSEGARTNLRGYTAEQIVAAHYIDAGCSVEIPATSNMPGYDLLIDGSPVQVKCGVGSGLLADHFDKYPDIPVVANSDLAEQVGTLKPEFRDLVSTFDGFDLSSVQEILDRSLQGAEGLADADVPLFAVLVGAGKGAYRVWKGEIPVEDLPEWLVIELSVRGALAAGGKVAGGFIGLLAIGPAGAVIAAPVLGVVALLLTGKAKTGAEKLLFREWHAEVMQEAQGLSAAMREALDRRTDALFHRALAFDAARVGMAPDLATLLYGRAVDDAIFAVECEEDLILPKDVTDLPELLLALGRLNVPDMATARARRRVENVLARKPTLRGQAKSLLDKAKAVAAQDARDASRGN